MSQFPNCERAGIKPFERNHGFFSEWLISASEVERVLAAHLPKERNQSPKVDESADIPHKEYSASIPPKECVADSVCTLFTAEDFREQCPTLESQLSYCARVANAKLAKWLESAPVVHIENESEVGFGWSGIQNIAGGEHIDNYSHTARLVDIRPLKAKEDNAEDLLREFVAYCSECEIDTASADDPARKLYDRARAYLERKRP